MPRVSILRRSGRSRGGRHLWRDTASVAAIEFATVVSVLLLMLLGICDVVPTWLAYTHVSTAASTAADVAGRFSQMLASDMVNVYAAAADVMSPFSPATQSMRITNVFSDGKGHAKVYWSCGPVSMPPYAALSSVTSTPTGVAFTSFLWLYDTHTGITLNGTNTSYIVSEVAYAYSPPALFVFTTPFNLTGVSYYLPRESAYVGFPWDGTSTDAPTIPTAATRSISVKLSNGVTCNYAD